MARRNCISSSIGSRPFLGAKDLARMVADTKHTNASAVLEVVCTGKPVGHDTVLALDVLSAAGAGLDGVTAVDRIASRFGIAGALIYIRLSFWWSSALSLSSMPLTALALAPVNPPFLTGFGAAADPAAARVDEVLNARGWERTEAVCGKGGGFGAGRTPLFGFRGVLGEEGWRRWTQQ